MGEEVGVLGRLKLTGRVESDELVRLYREAAVVVVPSRYEGFDCRPSKPWPAARRSSQPARAR